MMRVTLCIAAQLAALDIVALRQHAVHLVGCRVGGIDAMT
jgi:hypothetical protein